MEQLPILLGKRRGYDKSNKKIARIGNIPRQGLNNDERVNKHETLNGAKLTQNFHTSFVVDTGISGTRMYCLYEPVYCE